MNAITFHPFVLFGFSFIVLCLSAQIGALLHRTQRATDEGLHEDFGVILAATLTLLGLVIGFTFSMAINRYDQRKNYEEAEANAIGTEFARADLLPASDAAKVRALLKNYVDQRVLFYLTRDEAALRDINARTNQLQADLWSSVQAPASAQPTPIIGLAVAGMNDVLNAQGYTQAAFWNRIPVAAWGLMVVIAVCGNMLMGFGSHTNRLGAKRLLILPLVVSIAFMLIADIDSPRRGLIEVNPQNLLSLVDSLRPR
jgi:hypothetical protein